MDIKYFKSFYDYYYENRPRSFFFYLFYPITGPIALIFSIKARQEIRLYMNILGVIALALVMSTVTGYHSAYRPYLGFSDALGIVVGELFFVFVLLVMFVMPMLTMTFEMTFSGARKSLQRSSFLALLLAVPCGIFTYTVVKNDATVGATGIVMRKIEKPKFQKDIGETAAMFLGYQARIFQGKTPNSAFVDKALTKKLRTFLTGTLPQGQAKMFATLVVRDAQSRRPWLGLLLLHHDGDRLLWPVRGMAHCGDVGRPAAIRERSKRYVYWRRVLRRRSSGSISLGAN